MEKADEDTSSEVYTCRRCNQEYCSDCNPQIEVDFDVKEDKGDYNQDTRINRKGEIVCPFCYNQLIDKSRKDGI